MKQFNTENKKLYYSINLDARPSFTNTQTLEMEKLTQDQSLESLLVTVEKIHTGFYQMAVVLWRQKTSNLTKSNTTERLRK